MPKGGRVPKGGRALRGMIAQIAADGANMVDNGGKRHRSEHEGNQNTAAGGEAAGVSAPRPQPKVDSHLRSEDETSDGTMATNSHYPLPKIHRSKRQCVRERDLAWASGGNPGLCPYPCAPHSPTSHAVLRPLSTGAEGNTMFNTWRPYWFICIPRSHTRWVVLCSRTLEALVCPNTPTQAGGGA